MAAGEAPPKRHCPACGSNQMLDGKATSAKIVLGEDTLLRMCIGCHHTWPAMDMTNRDHDLATQFADRINGLMAAGIAIQAQAMAAILDEELERTAIETGTDPALLRRPAL